MTDAMIVEAIRASGGIKDAQIDVSSPAAVADPAQVARFNAAMATQGPAGVSAPDAIPFASEASAAWRSAQVNNQGLIHRIRALTQMNASGNIAAPEMIELQYEVMNLSFQQEVVTKIADKSSTAIQTLIKNQ